MISIDARGLRKFSLIGLTALGLSSPLPAAAEPLLRSRATMTLPAYDEAVRETDVARYADEQTYEGARGDRRFVLERLTYSSDGLEVIAYLVRARKGGARPGVIFNRGSFVRSNAAPEMLTLMHNMAAQGFTVLAPMYRGSEGAPGADELGGADLADLMATSVLAREIPSIDPGALYLYGESRGAMMVYQAMRDGYPARAAAVFGGFTDLEGLIAADPERMSPMTSFIWPDFEENSAAIIEKRSALRFVDALTTPLLIMHGGQDGDVPLRQALDLADALAARERDFDLVVYGDDSHMLPAHAAERDARAAAWFKEH